MNQSSLHFSHDWRSVRILSAGRPIAVDMSSSVIPIEMSL